LADPRIEPTNHRAERALRPAVIARKVSQCSKNDRGARAFAAFTSVIRTLLKTETASVVDTLSHLLHPPRGRHAST
jgi:transposase